MSVSAGGQRAKAADSARPAISASTDLAPASGRRTAGPSRSTNSETPTSDGDGSGTIESGSVPGSQNSSSFDGHSSGSSKHWRTPSSARQFAAQANQIATAVLNGEVDLESAKTYSAIARTAAQMLTAEVQRARFLQTAPDLSLEWEEDDL